MTHPTGEWPANKTVRVSRRRVDRSTSGDVTSRTPPARSRRVAPHSLLSAGLEHLTADGNRLGRYLREGDDARRRALVHPVVNGAPLHQHVASLEVHAGAVDFHFDPA